MTEPTLQTRREFLKTGLIGSALTWTVPSFVQSTVMSLYADQDGALIQQATGKDAPILVILQLAGGNDGLNTVIPVDNDFYHQARPKLRIQKKEALSLEGGMGLNPALTGFKELYDAGHLAIVQGVGYPNPNRSHFRSMEIWHTASDADKTEYEGWLGRYFDNACQGMDPTVGIHIGREAPQAFAGKNPMGITFDNPESYRHMGEDSLLTAYLDLEGDNTGGSIGAFQGRRAATTESPIDFLERTSLNAQISSEDINRMAATRASGISYPGGKLARELSLIARLIQGGMSSRVYYVSQGGYDTHVSQKGVHQRLLGEMGHALNSFVKDLKAQGNLERVTIMSFSEFGRRVHENGSAGTDHGAAAPLFVLGGKVRPGLHGALPSLNPRDLDKGDLRFGTDFRSVYATLLEKSMGASSNAILKAQFPLLDIMG